MRKLFRPFLLPEKHKINFWNLNGLVILSTLILWIKYSFTFQFDISFPIFPFIFLSLFGLIILFFGFHGYLVTYYFGVVCFLWYIYNLWETHRIEAFIMTLYLYPVLLPSFPIFMVIIPIFIDFLLKLKKQKRYR